MYLAKNLCTSLVSKAFRRLGREVGLYFLSNHSPYLLVCVCLGSEVIFSSISGDVMLLHYSVLTV